MLVLSGHVDPGENELQTALRETQEEAGLTEEHFCMIDGAAFKKVLNYQVRGEPKQVVYWLAELKKPDTPVVLSDEHVGYKWLKLAEALEHAKYQDMQETLKEAEGFISGTPRSDL